MVILFYLVQCKNWNSNSPYWLFFSFMLSSVRTEIVILHTDGYSVLCCPVSEMKYLFSMLIINQFYLVQCLKCSNSPYWLYILVMVNWQLSKQCICWPIPCDHTAGSGLEFIKVKCVFFEVDCCPVTGFQLDCRLEPG